MILGSSRGVKSALGLAAVLLGLLLPAPARAGQPDDGPALERPALSAFEGPLALPPMPTLTLETPALLAAPAVESMFFGPPILAKRKRDRTFSTELGEKDPRVRERPRTHRFRLALHAQWIRLTRTQNPATGEFERFHFAPMMIDLGYQAQFLKYVMVRLAVAVGGNVANTRNAMPLALFPQGYVGYQGKIIGLAFGYGFDWTIPPNFHVTAASAFALEQPVITRNHVVMGELSATSRIDRVALTFALAIGGVQSDLTHFDTANRKFRPYFGFQLGAFFDGSRRREKKALKKAEAEGR